MAPNEPTVELGNVGLRVRQLAAGRSFGLASVLWGGAAALAAVASAPLVAAGAGVVSLALGLFALRGAVWGAPRRGHLQARGKELTLEGLRVVRAADVEYVLPMGTGGVLVGVRGRELSWELGAPARRELLAALRDTDDAVTVRWRRHLRPLLTALGAFAGAMLVGGAVTDTLADVPVLGGLVATLLVMFAVWLAPRTDSLTIGKDGVAIRKAVERFVPLDEIRGVRLVAPARGGRVTGPTALALDLRDGASVRVEVGDGDALLLEAVRTEIEDRRSTARRGGSGRGVLERLMREGRSAAEWVSALEALLRGDGGFRDTAVSEDDVLAVLEDVSAPAEARIGAAIALARQGEDHADLVRMVAADVASPRLRVALDEATHGEASDERIDAAVAEEAHAVGRSG